MELSTSATLTLLFPVSRQPSSSARLPQPTPVADCSVARLSPHFRYYSGSPTTNATSLSVSLSLIGLLIAVPPANGVSPPEVTRRSSIPCRPQTPWYGG